MLDLTVDVRKAFDAGIGTYIRNVVPPVLDRLDPNVRVTALVAHDQLDRYDWLTAHGSTALVPMRSRPFSIAEQFEFRRRLGTGTLFWATSLAHPLWHHGPIVATMHDVAQLALGRSAGVSTPVFLAVRLLLASLRRRATAIVAVSDFTRREFERYVGRPACGDITLTPLGVDASWFDAVRGTDDQSAPRFVCVGSLRSHKNVARLLQAYSLVADRLPHRLVVAGLAPDVNPHEAWLSTLPPALRQRIHFTGQLPDTELRSLVAGADALVFPSLYEGFGLPALEAMAAGCPVLASSAGALPEVCGGAAASSFDPLSVEQIGQALLQHSSLGAAQRRAIVERGIAHARAFTWERTADLSAEVIRVLLRQQGVRR
ncbi:MAG: glycosyltransferase family 4 protein [Thiobacillus sp.]